MCGPMLLALPGMALGIVGAFAQAQGQKQEIDAYNQTAAYNRQSAALARNEKDIHSTYNYINEQRKLRTKGFDVIQKGRKDAATATASAASVGVTGHSVDAVYDEIMGFTARDSDKVLQDKRISYIDAYAQTKTHYAENLQIWYNNQPKGYGPVYASLGMGIANAVAGGLSSGLSA